MKEELIVEGCSISRVAHPKMIAKEWLLEFADAQNYLKILLALSLKSPKNEYVLISYCYVYLCENLHNLFKFIDIYLDGHQ